LVESSVVTPAEYLRRHCSATSVGIVVIRLPGNAKGFPASPTTLVHGLALIEVVGMHITCFGRVWKVMGVVIASMAGPSVPIVVRGQCPITIVGHETCAWKTSLNLFRKTEVLPVTAPMREVPVVELGSLDPKCVATLHTNVRIVITNWVHLISSAGILNRCVRAPTALKINNLDWDLIVYGKVSVLQHFFPLPLLLSDFITLINTNRPTFVICASPSHFAVNAAAAALLTSHQAWKHCRAFALPSRFLPITTATWKTFNRWRHRSTNVPLHQRSFSRSAVVTFAQKFLWVLLCGLCHLRESIIRIRFAGEVAYLEAISHGDFDTINSVNFDTRGHDDHNTCMENKLGY